MMQVNQENSSNRQANNEVNPTFYSESTKREAQSKGSKTRENYDYSRKTPEPVENPPSDLTLKEKITFLAGGVLNFSYGTLLFTCSLHLMFYPTGNPITGTIIFIGGGITGFCGYKILDASYKLFCKVL